MRAFAPTRLRAPSRPGGPDRAARTAWSALVTVDAVSDEELLARAAREDVDALAALYDRHRSIAYGVALRITGSVPAAEDVLQEAFLGVWRQAGSFDRSRGPARTWLLAIVHHRAVDAVRRRRGAEPLPELDAMTPPSMVVPDIWSEVAERLDAEAVRRALASLPAPQREAIELAYWGGLTQVEIAARENLPLGTVKGRMRLGLQALARAFREPADPGAGVNRSAPDGSAPSRQTPSSAEGRAIGRLQARLVRGLGSVYAALRLLSGSTRSAA